MYMSFVDFMEKKRYRFQKRLWENDKMYRSKIWKAHRREYKEICTFGKYAHDLAVLDQEVLEYELHILHIRRANGMIDDAEYRKMEIDILGMLS